MAEREEDATGEASTGMTQEWVPAALRGPSEPGLGPPRRDGDEEIGDETPPEADVDDEVEVEEAEDEPRQAADADVSEAGEEDVPASDPVVHSDGEDETAPDSEAETGATAEPGPVGEAEIEGATAAISSEALVQLEERLAVVERRFGEADGNLQSTAETADELSRVMQRSSERAGERLDVLEGSLEELTAAQAERLEAMAGRLERLEAEAGTEREGLADRISAVEAGFETLREKDAEGRGESEERLAGLIRGFETDAESNRRAVDALAESVGMKSGEISGRQMTVEQGLGELRLELDGARTKFEEVARALQATMQQLSSATQSRLGELEERANASIEGLTERLSEQATKSLGAEATANQRLAEVAEELTRQRDATGERRGELARKETSSAEAVEARLELIESRIGEAGAERAERLAPLERGLEELGGAIERTRAAFIKREKERHGSLQSSIDSIAAGLDARLARVDASFAGRIEALEEAQAASTPPPPAAPEPSPGDPAAKPARVPEVPAGTAVPIAPRAPIDVNEVTFEQLRAIGLSVTQASRLLDLRSSRGGFHSLQELAALPGFPDSLRERMSSVLTLSD